MSAVLSVALDGITDVPRGYAATIKSYLARSLPEPAPLPVLPVDLVRLTGDAQARYRDLFRALGQRWLWWSRLMLADDTLATLLDDPRIEAFAVCRNGQDIGLLELDFRETSADLAFLGLVDGVTGAGLGTHLMGWALQRARKAGARDITVNTCTFDHPAALGFYRRNGFSVLRQAIEIVPDPRLVGLLPPDAAPHVPLLAP